MDQSHRLRIADLLDRHRVMTVATLRPDGWPQATIVGYVNEGLAIYFLVSPQSQKFANITRDPRVSITVGKDTPDPFQITGLSMAARVRNVEAAEERARVFDILVKRYPEYAAFPREQIEAMAMLRADPTVVSVLDYSKGFGHAGLVNVEPTDFPSRQATAATVAG